MNKLLGFLSFVLIFTVSCWANTYYVDFLAGNDSNSGTSKTSPWRHAPGMVGCVGTCASTVLVDGNSVVFRGGVTWTGVFPWSLQGGSSSMITYTTDHTWYNGASWSQPTLDDQHLAQMFVGFVNIPSGGHHVTINDLNFVNWGTSGTSYGSGAYALLFTDTHDITLTNNTFRTYSWINIFFVFSTQGSYSNFVVTGNDFSHTSGAIWFATSTTGTTMHNFTYDGNTAHDFADMIGGGAHGDGFLHYFGASSGADSTSYMDGFEFCNNFAYGDFTRGIAGTTAQDMTGLIYLEGGVTNPVICNNVLTFFPGQNAAGTAQIFDAPILIDGKGNTHATGAKIVNNLIWGDPSSTSGYRAIRNENYTNSVIANNIVVFNELCAYGGASGPPAGLVEDYNEWYCGGFSNWITPSAHDLGATAPFSSNPLLAGPLPPPLISVYFTAGSPAKGAGQDLTSLGITTLNSDYLGLGRPASGAWDMGPFQSAGSAAVPTGLTVTAF